MTHPPEVSPVASPEAFLELVERDKLGRLKVYLGFAAGVGKTFHMLEEAHALKRRDIDIVLGLIETHGRAETAALIEGLDLVPRKRVAYRDVTIEEMDLDGILARKPQVAIVDEVAHTNVPGSRNRRRYQDILEILKAGINVICAFNIQHLESLNHLVERSTGVPVREIVPDTFLKQADQVVTVDLDVNDLIERLRAGKIYAPDKVTLALDSFFKTDNLSALRELALREVAERLEGQKGRREASFDHPQGTPATRRVMVCLASASPRAPILLQRGSRLAGRLNTHWFVVYVETPRESSDRIDSETQRLLMTTFEMARELGAEIVRIREADPVSGIITFARSHGVGDIIVGGSHQPWWKQVLGLSPIHRLVNEAQGFDLHVISFDEEKRP
ncbi:MAG: histidine kinase [Candidatus Ozemobacteraceae bacterium]